MTTRYDMADLKYTARVLGAPFVALYNMVNPGAKKRRRRRRRRRVDDFYEGLLRDNPIYTELPESAYRGMDADLRRQQADLDFFGHPQASDWQAEIRDRSRELTPQAQALIKAFGKPRHHAGTPEARRAALLAMSDPSQPASLQKWGKVGQEYYNRERFSPGAGWNYFDNAISGLPMQQALNTVPGGVHHRGVGVQTVDPFLASELARTERESDRRKLDASMTLQRARAAAAANLQDDRHRQSVKLQGATHENRMEQIEEQAEGQKEVAAIQAGIQRERDTERTRRARVDAAIAANRDAIASTTDQMSEYRQGSSPFSSINLDNLDYLIGELEGGMETGRVSGWFGNLLQDPRYELLRTINLEGGLAQRVAGTGTMSDKEMAVYMGAAPGPDKSEEYNLSALRRIRQGLALAEARMARMGEYQALVRRNNDEMISTGEYVSTPSFLDFVGADQGDIRPGDILGSDDIDDISDEDLFGDG